MAHPKSFVNVKCITTCNIIHIQLITFDLRRFPIKAQSFSLELNLKFFKSSIELN